MNHSMKRRIAATLLIGLSATGIGYAEEPAATKTMPVATTKSPEQSKTGWLAEQMAVTDFGDSIQYWQAASENEGPLPSVTKNNLADIGKSYTANNLPALGDTADDYAIEGYRLGDHFTAPKDVERTSVRDNFTTYFMKDFDVTVYTGPAKERLVDNQLRGQGANYFFEPNTITNIHSTKKGTATVRDIGPGSTRMELVFAYGSPNAMWRDQKNETYIFLYEGHEENSWDQKKEFTTSVENTNNNSQKKSMLDDRKNYIAFTIKNNTVEAVDFISGQVWPRFGLPKAPVYNFEAGKLTADDFVLRGFQLNDHFVNDPNNEWKTQGMLFGSTFIGYNEYGVSVDKNSLINRVLLNIYTPTRRGIAMGDTKYLLLFVYGMPTRIVESTTNTGTATVYEYKNPAASNSYLQFALDDKNQYIKSVMLSDRPVK
ncbi:hypothetical protein [Veillonella sp. AS16]|uniref:hypothetical protein n=1 Tax=Veillonella sp. AS16 TaxID=936589 RepID=UPI0003E29517|nr:hypothetical protein [Veillonella sp. AS16]ETS93938.1 hypothetical protein HMPREF1521_0768 [Veillonella sp. AS16]